MASQTVSNRDAKPAQGLPSGPRAESLFALDALDLVASCLRDLAKLDPDRDDAQIVRHTYPHLRRLLPYGEMGFFLVSEQDADFLLADNDPPECGRPLQTEMEAQIDAGVFAWALEQNRTVLVRAQRLPGAAVTLHALWGRSGVVGMFIGVLRGSDAEVTPLSLNLLSIFLSSCAQLLENSHLYRRLRGYTTNLERLVEDRTADLRTALAKAEEAAAAKSGFLATMTHEIRTPMNAVLGYTQLLQRDRTLSPSQREIIDIIGRSGEHLLGLINDILEMSKIEAGHTTLNVEDFDFHALLNDLDAMFRVRTVPKHLDFAIRRAADVPRFLRADGRKVRQILINLLGNAVKFTDTGGITLAVSCSQDAARPTVPPEAGAGMPPPAPPALVITAAVTDTGCGIAAAEHGKLFQAFEQTRSSRGQSGGTGLGLAISRRFARLMDGDVTAISEPGKGSTFCLVFRAASGLVPGAAGATTAQPQSIVGLPAGHPAPKVLVVDDTETNRALLRLLLTKIGFDVRVAASGEAAVTAVQSWSPDVVFMDWFMPEMDGLEATRAIKALAKGGRSVPVIMVTAQALEEARREAMAAGVDGFVRKPYKAAEVLEEARRALGLEYVYAADTAPAGGSAAEASAAGSAIRRLPPEVVNTLLETTETGDAVRLQELIRQEVSPLSAELGHELLGLAADYEYDRIVRLLTARR